MTDHDPLDDDFDDDDYDDYEFRCDCGEPGESTYCGTMCSECFEEHCEECEVCMADRHNHFG